jgi:hypothetical protein
MWLEISVREGRIEPASEDDGTWKLEWFEEDVRLAIGSALRPGPHVTLTAPLTTPLPYCRTSTRQRHTASPNQVCDTLTLPI